MIFICRFEPKKMEEQKRKLDVTRTYIFSELKRILFFAKKAKKYK
jgi:hypothetical protein